MNASAQVYRLDVSTFSGGDPNSSTCHICHAPPRALCVRCWTYVCKVHSPSCCATPRYVGEEAPAWKIEQSRRYVAWKGLK